MRTIPYNETLLIEFKSDRKGGYPDRDLVEAVVAMANSDGGVLYLGVEDNGEITGLVKKHEDEIGLSAMIMNNIVPTLFISVEMINVEEKIL
ncbi:helix-turn-helix domain-containing protein [Thomasclavelia sp.]|uniref:AlbA family DNA-binding domain-containing protein n=1 Tax=Thomasclavelia sp. TaxID=3025757 RepID=UPI0025CDB71C|nr:ATP-binding protein [Thomasclavelia sp.]